MSSQNKKLFVWKLHSMKTPDDGFKEILPRHVEYLTKVSSERFYIGGEFKGKNKGMIIIEALDLEEAHEIAMNDPFVVNGYIQPEVLEWDVQIIANITNLKD